MSEDDKNKIIDRIFTELDRNTGNIEKLSKVVYTQSSTLSLVTKIVVIIITFLIVTSLTILYNSFSDNSLKSDKEIEKTKINNSQINDILKEDYLAIEINKKGLFKNVWKRINIKNFI